MSKKDRDKQFELDIIIETPKGCRNKFKFDEEKQCYRLSDVLTAGSVFPYDFGFIPETLGQDGDPLDILVLMDEPAFTGCMIPVRLVGVTEAEQTEDGETGRNDRIIAVAQKSHTHKDVDDLKDVSPTLLDEIEHFFISYTEMQGKVFRPLARKGPKTALELIITGKQKLKKKKKKK